MYHGTYILDGNSEIVAPEIGAPRALLFYLLKDNHGLRHLIRSREITNACEGRFEL